MRTPLYQFINNTPPENLIFECLDESYEVFNISVCDNRKTKGDATFNISIEYDDVKKWATSKFDLDPQIYMDGEDKVHEFDEHKDIFTTDEMLLDFVKTNPSKVKVIEDA